MAAYIVAIVSITDPVRFGDYVKAIAGLTERYGGEYIVRGTITEVLEGDVDSNETVVVTRFPSTEAARACARSPEYLAGAALRQGAARVERRLVVVPE